MIGPCSASLTSPQTLVEERSGHHVASNVQWGGALNPVEAIMRVLAVVVVVPAVQAAVDALPA